MARPGVALHRQTVFVAVGAQRALRDDFDLALTVDRDFSRVDPAMYGWRTQLERASRAHYRFEVIDNRRRGHTLIIGNPNAESIGIPCRLSGIFLGMPVSTIADRVAKAREALGLAPADFAKLLGIKQPTLWQLENGKSKRPRADTLMAMAAAGINPDYIMKNKGPILLAEFERTADEQAIVESMRELADEERAQVRNLIRLFRRNSGKPGTDDPFLELPPKRPAPKGGTQ